MPPWKLCVRLESLSHSPRRAIELAAELGADGIEFDAIGDLAPDQLSATGRRQFRQKILSQGLSIYGIGFPTRHGFDTLERLEKRIQLSLDALRLSSDLGSGILAKEIGQIPSERNDPQHAHFFDAIEIIGSEAMRLGGRFSILTGPDSPDRLFGFLTDMNNYGLGVHYDPANLMVRGHNAYDGVRLLHGFMSGVHLRDAIRSGTSISGFREVPIGRGEVDWQRFLGALEEIEYRAAATVHREPGPTSLEDCRQAIAYFREY